MFELVFIRSSIVECFRDSHLENKEIRDDEFSEFFVTPFLPYFSQIKHVINSLTRLQGISQITEAEEEMRENVEHTARENVRSSDAAKERS